MTAVLIQIDAWDPIAAAAVVLRAASLDDERVCHLDGQTWWPALKGLPALRYDLFDGAFGARIVSPQSSLTLATELWPDFGRYMLADARIRVWTGEIGAAWAGYVLRFDGRVLAQPAVSGGVATIGFGVDDKWLDTPLLTTYAGTGGIEGPLALKGQPKPLCLGSPRYVAGQMIDAAASVLQLSAYGLMEDVEMALERLARFGASFGDYASYAALVAAAIPAGRWATCKGQGLVRHGAPPAGRLSYLVKGDKAGPDGWVRLPGAMIKRIALLSGGAGRISEASVDALDVARPWPISLYVSEQDTARNLIQRIAASVNAVAGVSWTGQLFVVPVGIGASSVTLDAGGESLPPVKGVDPLEVAAPYWRLTIGAEPTWNVHPLSDVAFTAMIVPRGLYLASESYREGHQVDLANGSSWLYVNPAASTGNAPPAVGTSNAWWQQIAPPTSLAAIGYGGDPNATRNEDGANMIPSPMLFDRAEFGNGAFLSIDPAGTGRPLTRRRASLPNTVDAYVFFEAGAVEISTVPGERLYASYVTQGSGVTSDSVVGNLQYHDALGALVSQATMPESRVTGTQSGGLPLAGRGSAVTPDGVSFVRFRVFRETAANAGSFLVAEGVLGRSQQGADVTVIPDGPAESTVFNYDYAGNAEAGQFPRNLTYRLMGPTGPVTAGVVWTWKVLSGGTNSVTGGPYPVTTVNGVGTLGIAHLQADTTKIELTATYNGLSKSITTQLTKKFGAAPVASGGGGGGGGSGTLASKSSGFNGFENATMVNISGDISFTLSATATVSVVVNLLADPEAVAAHGSFPCTAKVQRIIAGTPTDQGAAMTQSSEVARDLEYTPVRYYSNPAAFIGTRSLGSLPAGTYTIRVVASQSGATKFHYVSGSVTVTV